MSDLLRAFSRTWSIIPIYASDVSRCELHHTRWWEIWAPSFGIICSNSQAAIYSQVSSVFVTEPLSHKILKLQFIHRYLPVSTIAAFQSEFNWRTLSSIAPRWTLEPQRINRYSSTLAQTVFPRKFSSPPTHSSSRSLAEVSVVARAPERTWKLCSVTFNATRFSFGTPVQFV